MTSEGTSLPSLSHDSFSSLNSSLDPPPPLASSSPVRSQGKKHKIEPPLRVIGIKCQSLANKRSILIDMVDRVKPDIIIGAESWIKPKHLSSEIFPPDFNIFRKDRLNKKGEGHL